MGFASLGDFISEVNVDSRLSVFVVILCFLVVSYNKRFFSIHSNKYPNLT